MEQDGLSVGDASSDGNRTFDDGGEVFRDGSGDGSRIPPDGDAPDSDTPDANVEAGGCTVECNILHVAPFGDDNADGSIDHPLATIQAAVKRADEARNVVHVGSGAYNESVTIANAKLTLEGGYECASATRKCSWTSPPNAADHLTTIESPLPAGGLVFEATTTHETIVRGFQVQGRGGQLPPSTTFPGSVAVAILGGTPKLETMRIKGGALGAGGAPSNARRSVALYITGSNNSGEIVVKGSLIDGGPSQGGSVGVWIGGEVAGAQAPRFKIQNSEITAAKGDTSIGVVVNASHKDSLLLDNDINSAATDNTTPSVASWGVTISSGVKVYRNRINMKAPFGSGNYCPTSAGTPCGGIFTLNAQETYIEANLIHGVPAQTSFGVLITSTLAGGTDVSVNGNYVRGNGVGVASAAASSISAAIGLRNAPGARLENGRVRNNILMGGPNAKSYGVYESETPNAKMHLQVMEHNDFWNVTHLYGAWGGSAGSPIVDFDTFAGVPVAEKDGNIHADPQITVNASDLTLGDDSPCINAGIDKEVFSDDIDGQARPVAGNIDIGPDDRGD